jgi:hypothetical protein
MSFFTQISRLEQLDHLIRTHGTGNAKELAEKLGISESSLFLLLQAARELGAEIRFNHYRCTYEYETPMHFSCGFEMIDRKDMHKIHGGNSMYFRQPLHSNKMLDF